MDNTERTNNTITLLMVGTLCLLILCPVFAAFVYVLSGVVR